MVTRFHCSNTRSSQADDCISRCVGCELWLVAGAAEAKFLTAGNTEFKADHRVKAVVWLGLVPLLASKGADEALGDAGLHTNTGTKKSRLW